MNWIVPCITSAFMVLLMHIIQRLEKKIDNLCDNHLSDLAILKKECPLLNKK